MSKNKPAIKAAKQPALSASRDLVTVGPRHVQVKHQGKRDENGHRPTTSRALVIRNGKYGARGTGEVMLATKLSGREKLDLLAEDLIEKSQRAVMSPLRLENCLRIADSQFNAYLDDITNLQDPEFFFPKIKAEVEARTPYSGRADSMQNPSYVASVIAIRIHNAYMIASGWKLVVDVIRSLQREGLSDRNAHVQLQQDESLRSRYLILCDMVNDLVELEQRKFSVLATTTPHYARYFKAVEAVEPGEAGVAFDWAELKDACKSFLDSIIIELCFPRAPYPRRVLYQILHDAVEESPGEARRFPQSLWDAVGELSVTLELQELLEAPLLGHEGQKLKALPRQMPEQYELWLDAQIYSRQASNSYANYKDLVFPLEKTKNRTILENMWKFINLNYKSVSNMSIDTLWQLDEALRRTPQWSAFYMPNMGGLDSDSDADHPPDLLPIKSKRGKSGPAKSARKLLAITDGRADDDSDGSMPGLQSVSDSSDESDHLYDSDDPGDGQSAYSDDYDDDDSEYDSEEEEQYRDLLREAMDTAMAIPEFFDPKTEIPEFEAMAEERKGNPFLKLLGSLRGRMFSSNSKLSSAKRTEPRKGAFAPKVAPTPKSTSKAAPAPVDLQVDWSKLALDELPPLQPLSVPRKKRVAAALASKPVATPAPAASQDPVSQRTTVEDVEDEDDTPSTAGKKKKKKKTKKKKTGLGDIDLESVRDEPGITSPMTPAKGGFASPPVSPASAKRPTSTINGSSTTTLPNMSTATLPLDKTIAQSGHSYLQELGGPKEKIKSRPDHASLFSANRGFLSKLSGKEKAKEPKEKDKNMNKKHGWFSNLGKKTGKYMHQLLRTSEDDTQGLSSMKWENFLKLMRDMGFSYDPSTAGSSVRFDPPHEGDRSITFHKPHPDPTLHPMMLREFAKKLKEYYGWSEEDFYKKVN
ncbi:hypothetical protein BV22DRAFT_1035310 [Leucogyrophana mollusca]|uniref:Uncharacterized protein n=1 Tax=Leucogyrophana mollusca TaxID=85980 RepID=A0ACB8BFE3_9AGAM|nr:hypothetical protein BV22DRAFT_1035310 [Leucogyrophana mollusca]